MSDGKIITCDTANCGHKCCQFQHGNYIVLYPGELGEANLDGKKTEHLKIIDYNYHGGQKAVCRANDAATCDGGLKPLDCKSYPFFPAPPQGGSVNTLLKGEKCPLQAGHLNQHAATVREEWNAAIAVNPTVSDWLDNVELVGYTPVRFRSINATAQRLRSP